MDALSGINPRNPVTPQKEQALPNQVPNNAGGYVFKISEEQRALRFLILGTDGGTYYQNERGLTKENAAVILHMAENDGATLVKLIVDVSTSGRAPRQNPTIFALAACTASLDASVRKAALDAVPTVCRTGTMLFMFAHYVKQFRGFGRGLREAIGKWYLNPSVDQVAYQAVKYRSRRVEGQKAWTHRDLLRLSHPITSDPNRSLVFNWITKGDEFLGEVPIIHGYRLAQKTTSVKEWVRLINDFHLSWEMLPDAALAEPDVWRALLPHMGLTALMRNLGRLSKLGVLKPLDSMTMGVTHRLIDPQEVIKARLHPIKVLDALETYKSGHGLKGSLAWPVVPSIVDALDECFYKAFGAITPSNKPTLLALDVSASMEWGAIANSRITPRVGSAAMAMVTARTEPNHMIMAYTHRPAELFITPKMTLGEVVKNIAALQMGGTDCSLPFIVAQHNNLSVDTFVSYTDNETHSGSIHVHEALRNYRNSSGNTNARSIVVGMTSTGFSIADPDDPYQLDVVGFDTSAPEIISSFSRGDF
jgi:60 kDa SS-A/Ro ribonucleoprotein